MDFATLPPEINSARMYTGAGSAPLLTAAASWDGLAADLHSTAGAYGSVIAELAGAAWSGPASASMAAAAARYVAWLTSTAGQAEQSANQARAAATAYETAFAMTVPPPVIAANRTLLASLVATNVLGQNTPAIACTEAHYAEMWAQDVTAMYGYAGSSASAAQLTAFTAPAPTTNAEGLAVQAATTARAVGGAAGHAQTVIAAAPQLLSHLVSEVPRALQSLASPASTTSLSSLVSELSASAPYAGVLAGGVGVVGAGSGVGAGSVGLVDIVLGIVGSTSQASVVAAGGGVAGSALPAAAGSGVGLIASQGAAGGTAPAGFGRAVTVGALSVPQTWAPTAPTPTPATAIPALQLTADTIPTAMPPGMWSALPVAQLAGRAGAAAGPRFVAARRDTGPRTDERATAAI